MMKIKLKRLHNQKNNTAPCLKWLLPAILASITLAIFLPTLNYNFTNYDVGLQVVKNPLIRSLSLDNIYRIFTSFSITSYYPIRLLSYAIDYSIWRINPKGYHLTNVLFHTMNVLLVYMLLFRLTRPTIEKKSFVTENRLLLIIFFSASIFAFHPVVVESVVWIGAREELTMLFFTLICIHFHILAESSPNHTARYHLFTGLFCLLACLCNVVGAVIPMLVLAYDLCNEKKKYPASWKRLKEIFKYTWFLWPIAMGAIILKLIGKNIPTDEGLVTAKLSLGWIERVLTILNIYWLNIRTLMRPASLSIIYPSVSPNTVFEPGVMLGGAFSLITLSLLWRLRQNHILLFGLLWFLIGLSPSAQVIPHHILRADRFLYLPLVGIVLLIGHLMIEARMIKNHPEIHIAICISVLCILAIMSRHQSQRWRNSITLFEHVLLKTYPDSKVAHVNLGHALEKQGKIDKAIEHYSEALEIDPDFVNAHNNLGFVLAKQGKIDEATAHYYKALKINPNYRRALNNLGLALSEQGRLEEAATLFSKALQNNANDADAHNNLGLVFAKQGKVDKAITHFLRTVQINPDHAEAHFNLGAAWLSSGQYKKAFDSFSNAYNIFLKMNGKTDQKTRNAKTWMANTRKRINGRQ